MSICRSRMLVPIFFCSGGVQYTCTHAVIVLVRRREIQNTGKTFFFFSGVRPPTVTNVFFPGVHRAVSLACLPGASYVRDEGKQTVIKLFFLSGKCSLCPNATMSSEIQTELVDWEKHW